ncbi:urease accessory protein UreE [Acaryochloris sp. IP29b_bin.148]|uniref:urease accessory protein UreE n=1 Tax=Acaryochloris sp. IP29b_bin.148 TaxID=2969218 RepID=UPI0026113C70|nr:urease accessory protein UreE [Acaryochloris sp. IP29b_bin.148]
MSLVFIRKLSAAEQCKADLTLALTAEERTRSRHKFQTAEGQTVFLQLSRGTILYNGDLLKSESDTVLRIIARSEPVLTVQAATSLDLLRGAYHLGNRHVPLEITPTCLRLTPDPVLQKMLEQLGLDVTEDMHPFQPEAGAYGHHNHPSHPSTK